MTDTFILALVCLGLCVYVLWLQYKIKHLIRVIGFLVRATEALSTGEIKIVKTEEGLAIVKQGGE